jgi:preprotein translocase subunit SecA
MREGEAIESKLLSRQIERAQRKVESHNFDIRKNLLEYDDVANDQRKVVYHQRSELMEADEIEDSVAAIREEVIAIEVAQHIPPGSLEEQWNADGLMQALEAGFDLRVDVARWIRDDKTLNDEAILERCVAESTKAYEKRSGEVGHELMRKVEKQIMLHQLDNHWKEHLAGLDHLRQGIGLRSYAQKNPKQEYKREAFEMFGAMLEQVKHDVISILARVQFKGEQELDDSAERRRAAAAMKFQHADASALGGPQAPQPGRGEQGARAAAPPSEPIETFKREAAKVGRNEPCPCGSGKKYKQCHGKLA